jgi:malonate-semialdehyde dehydrogenase (acetylating)/methylmalonate-semialdehyde dehydrogenase
MATTISHWFDNKTFTGTSGASAPVTNPATGEVTGQVALASVEDARAVIDAAAAAFPAWRDRRVGGDHHLRARQGRLRRPR